MSSRVEDRYFKVVSGNLNNYRCVQCGTRRAELYLEAGLQTNYHLCPEDAIELALELVREAKAAMQEEKNREMVR